MDNDYYEFINDNVNINSMFDDNLSPFQEHDGFKKIIITAKSSRPISKILT